MTAATIAYMCSVLSLAGSSAWANSAELGTRTIPAASCVPSGNPAQNALAEWSLGSWILSKNGRFSLTCALPVGAGQLTGYRISYRDPDGRTGNASVKAFLLRTDVPPKLGPGNTTFLPCDFLSNAQGTATGSYTNQTVPCAESVRKGAFYSFRGRTLASRGGGRFC